MIGALSPVAIVLMKRFGTTAVVASGLALMSAGFVVAAGSGGRLRRTGAGLSSPWC